MSRKKKHREIIEDLFKQRVESAVHHKGRQYFGYVSDGFMQWIEEDGLTGLVVATDESTARGFLRDAMQVEGKRISVCEIGSSPGETLEGHINASRAEGATAIFILRGKTPKGYRMQTYKFSDYFGKEKS